MISMKEMMKEAIKEVLCEGTNCFGKRASSSTEEHAQEKPKTKVKKEEEEKMQTGCTCNYLRKWANSHDNVWKCMQCSKNFACGQAVSPQAPLVLAELAPPEATDGVCGLLAGGTSPGEPQGKSGSLEWTPERINSWRHNLHSWASRLGGGRWSKPAHLDHEQWRSHLAERKSLANRIDKAVSAGRLVCAAKHLRNMEMLLSKQQGG
jgi:hypothetical protein